jgi:hypothetical protein
MKVAPACPLPLSFCPRLLTAVPAEPAFLRKRKAVFAGVKSGGQGEGEAGRDCPCLPSAPFFPRAPALAEVRGVVADGSGGRGKERAAGLSLLPPCPSPLLSAKWRLPLTPHFASLRCPPLPEVGVGC